MAAPLSWRAATAQVPAAHFMTATTQNCSQPEQAVQSGGATVTWMARAAGLLRR